MTWRHGVDSFCLEHGFDVEDRRVMYGLLKQAVGFGNLNEALAGGNQPVEQPQPQPNDGETTIDSLNRLATKAPPETQAPGVAPVSPHSSTLTSKALKKPTPAGVEPYEDADNPLYAKIRPVKSFGQRWRENPTVGNLWNQLSQSAGSSWLGVPTDDEQRFNAEAAAAEGRDDMRQSEIASLTKAIENPTSQHAINKFRGHPGGVEGGIADAKARLARMTGRALPPEVAAVRDAMLKGDYSGAADPNIRSAAEFYVKQLNDQNLSPSRRAAAEKNLDQVLAQNVIFQRSQDEAPKWHAEGGRRLLQNMLWVTNLSRSQRDRIMNRFTDEDPVTPDARAPMYTATGKSEDATPPPGTTPQPAATSAPAPAKQQVVYNNLNPVTGQPKTPAAPANTATAQVKTPAAPTPLPGRPAEPQPQPLPQPQPQPLKV